MISALTKCTYLPFKRNEHTQNITHINLCECIHVWNCSLSNKFVYLRNNRHGRIKITEWRTFSSWNWMIQSELLNIAKWWFSFLLCLFLFIFTARTNNHNGIMPFAKVPVAESEQTAKSISDIFRSRSSVEIEKPFFQNVFLARFSFHTNRIIFVSHTNFQWLQSKQVVHECSREVNSESIFDAFERIQIHA